MGRDHEVCRRDRQAEAYHYQQNNRDHRREDGLEIGEMGMTAKEYLRQLPQLQLKIDILNEEIEKRRAKLTSTTIAISSDKVQTSSPGDRFADMIVALADKELQQEDLVLSCQALRDRIVSQILELNNAAQSRVLYERYVQGRRWEQISDDMHYSLQRVFQIHGNALTAFSEKYAAELQE